MALIFNKCMVTVFVDMAKTRQVRVRDVEHQFVLPTITFKNNLKLKKLIFRKNMCVNSVVILNNINIKPKDLKTEI